MEKPGKPMPMPQPKPMPHPQPLPQPPQMPDCPMPVPMPDHHHHMPPMPCMPPMHEMPCDRRWLRHMYHQLKTCHKYELEMLKWYMKYCESKRDCHRPHRRHPRGRNPYHHWESSSSPHHRNRWESPHGCC